MLLFRTLKPVASNPWALSLSDSGFAKTAAKVRRNPNTGKRFYTFLHLRSFSAPFQEHLHKGHTRNHKIGVTQTDHAGVTQTGTLGVTHTA